MISDNVKGVHRARRASSLLEIFGLAVLGSFALTPPASAAGPISIGAVNSSAPTGGVPLYGKFELTFSVNTSAASHYLPYDPVAPPYAANLRPTEDARQGVSVDALLLPPGQTDWSKAQVWPCYWQADFDANNNPTGGSGWHLRFAPTATGTWSYEIRATDASGSVTTSPTTFSCVPSRSKGFIHVSRTDTRYFEYGDGTPFIAAGANDAGPEALKIWQNMSAVGATGLHRAWLGSDGGLNLFGGYGGLTGAQGFVGWGASPTDRAAHSGRFSFEIPYTAFPQLAVNAVAGMAYTVSFWYKSVGTDPGAVLSFPPIQGSGLNAYWPASTGGQAGTYQGSAWTAADSNGWTHATFTWTPPLNGLNYIRVGVGATQHGYTLIDDLSITNPAGGDILGGAGSFEWHTDPNQAVALQVDSLVDTAASEGQYLKLVCLNKFDRSSAAVDTSGAPTSDVMNADRAMGGSPDPHADTPVQRFQRFYARYLMARWGYSPAVHSFEYANEMDYNHNLQYAGAEAFGAAIHAFTAEGRRLVTSSTCFNNAGRTYDPGFYENPAYPDIDYADFHFYPDSATIMGPYLPYDDVPNAYNVRGSLRVPSGGPSGHGCLKFSLPSQASGDPNNQVAMFPLPTMRGQGQWTIKALYKTSRDARFNQASWPAVQVRQASVSTGQVVQNGAAVVATAQMPAIPVTDWTEYTGTFTLPDSSPYPGGWLTIGGNLDPSTPAGSYSAYADVRLIAPNGKTFYRLTFDEPTFDKDSASIVQYLAAGKQSYSGDPAINKPLVLGESDLEVTVNGQDFTDPGLAQDTAGIFARQAFWGGALSPGAMIPVWWHGLGNLVTSNNGWRYLGAVQQFLQGVPLSNGRYRDAEAVASPTLRVIGQKDAQAGQAVLWVQNHGTAGDGSDAANWRNMTVNPSVCAPVSGSVAIPGLPDGTYQADVWDTSVGKVANSLFLTTSGGVLTVPISNLSLDEAVKIAPASAPNLTLHLTSDKSVVSVGDKITFTLNYTNNGSMPALGVNLPWPVPDHTTFVTASAGGSYDAGQNTVTWQIGTVPAGGSGSVTLTTLVK